MQQSNRDSLPLNLILSKLTQLWQRGHSNPAGISQAFIAIYRICYRLTLVEGTFAQPVWHLVNANGKPIKTNCVSHLYTRTRFHTIHLYDCSVAALQNDLR